MLSDADGDISVKKSFLQNGDETWYDWLVWSVSPLPPSSQSSVLYIILFESWESL